MLASLHRTVLRQNRKYFGSYPGQPEGETATTGRGLPPLEQQDEVVKGFILESTSWLIRKPVLMAYPFDVPGQRRFLKYLASVQWSEILGYLAETSFSFLLILDLPQVRSGESDF